MKKAILLAIVLVLSVVCSAAAQPYYPGSLYTYTPPAGACVPPSQTAGCITNTMFNIVAKEVQALEAILGINLTGLNNRAYAGISTTDRMALGTGLSTGTPATAPVRLGSCSTSDPSSVGNGDLWCRTSGVLKFRANGVTRTVASSGGSFLDLTDAPGAPSGSYVGNALKNIRVKGDETGLEFSAATVLAHDLLSDSHSDTVAAAPVLGDILFGNSTPKWDKLAGNTTAVKQWLSQTGTGSVSAAPVWAALAAGDIPSLDAAKITTGTFAEGRGGTNQSTYTLGDILYASATNALGKLAGNITTTRKFLTQTGTGSVSAAPGWNPIAAADLPVMVGSGASHAPGAVPDPSATPGTTKYLREDGTWVAPAQPATYTIFTAACQGTTAGSLLDLPATSPAVAACDTGTNIQKAVLDFAAASDLTAQIAIVLPNQGAGRTYNAAAATSVSFLYYSPTTTGDVVWKLATACTATGATAVDDPTFNTASTVTSTVAGTANRVQIATISTLDMTGCAAGNLLHLKPERNAGVGADTLADKARLIAIELTVPQI